MIKILLIILGTFSLSALCIGIAYFYILPAVLSLFDLEPDSNDALRQKLRASMA